MRFHSTLTIGSGDATVRTAEEITELIRQLGDPGQGYEVEADKLIWETTFEGETLHEVARRYRETQDEVAAMLPHSTYEWAPDPDDPVKHAQQTAKDVLEWEKHFDGVDLPEELREALEVVAGTEVPA